MNQIAVRSCWIDRGRILGTSTSATCLPKERRNELYNFTIDILQEPFELKLRSQRKERTSCGGNNWNAGCEPTLRRAPSVPATVVQRLVAISALYRLKFTRRDKDASCYRCMNHDQTGVPGRPDAHYFQIPLGSPQIPDLIF